MTRLIGLAAHAPGSGKTSASKALEDAGGFVCVPFAAPMKHMAMTLLTYWGLDFRTAQHHIYVDRVSPIPGVDVTGRHLLQTLGTEWGRQCLRPNFWIDCWSAVARRTLEAGDSVVVDDVRFPNEAEAIRALGGQVWLINRPELHYEGNHASEGGLRDHAFDAVLVNNSSLEDLHSAVLALLGETTTHG